MFYNVNTAKSIVKIFNICFFVGSTCIYSFLSVFLRHLGLSAFQVGLLRCLQSVTALICIPVVVLCGRKCLQRRPPMMSCLFLTMAAYLSLLVISLPAPSCFHKNYPICENYTGQWTRKSESALSAANVSNRHISQRSSSFAAFDETSVKHVTKPLTVPVEASFSNFTNQSTDSHHTHAELFTPPDNFSLTTVLSVTNDELTASFSPDKQNDVLSNYSAENKVSTHVFKKDGTSILEPISKEEKYVQISKRSNAVEKIKLATNVTFPKFQDKVLLWSTVDISCFIILLVILIIGEASASPVETIANDAWFMYLDEIDYLVAFAKRSISIPVSAAVAVFSVGCITIFYCGFGPALNAYSLHIYLFGIFFGFALVITTFYPFPQEQKSFYRSLVSVSHCLQGREAYMLFATATISGIPQAAYTEFTLWFIEDLGGSEFTTSTAVAVSLVSIALPQLFSKKLASISSRSAMVAFGMFCCAAQFLVYVAIQIPWAIVSSQVLQFASNYVFWTALKQHLLKVLKVKSEHSVALALKGFHLLGYAVGAVLNGMLYTYSPTLLFSTMALLALVWCLVLFFCEFCCLHRAALAAAADDREEEMKLFDDLQQDSEED